MAHYALIDDNNIVFNVIKGFDETDTAPDGFDSWEAWYADFNNCTVKRTSYNTKGGVHYKTSDEGSEFENDLIPSDTQEKSFRKNYAGIGYIYDADKDAFYQPQPYDSWILNEDTCIWEAPVAHPNDGNEYIWNEDTTNWELVV